MTRGDPNYWPRGFDSSFDHLVHRQATNLAAGWRDPRVEETLRAFRFAVKCRAFAKRRAAEQQGGAPS